jgi:O-methyltransferase
MKKQQKKSSAGSASALPRVLSAGARRVISWAVQNQALAPLGPHALTAISYGLSLNNKYVMSFRPERKWISDLIRSVRAQRQLLIRDDEAANILLMTAATSKIEGELAEVGVYQGASARLICEVKGNRTLHLFDTFEGLPAPGPQDGPEFVQGGFRCGLEDVQQYLSGYPNLHFYRGLFPSTAGPVQDRTFAFVNLDVDLYESTKMALEFFYPRMAPSGIILSHDYSGASGVRKTFEEFFSDKPEIIVELLGSQCMVVKLEESRLGAAKGPASKTAASSR